MKETDNRIISIQYEESNDITDIGTFREVVTTDETVFEDRNGNEVTLKDITVGDKVKAFLENQQNTENDPEGRVSKTSEIVLLEKEG